MKCSFISRKIKVSIEDTYFDDLKRHGVIITIWNKTGPLFRACSIRSNELDQDITRTLEILTKGKHKQAKRWFKKVINNPNS